MDEQHNADQDNAFTHRQSECDGCGDDFESRVLQFVTSDESLCPDCYRREVAGGRWGHSEIDYRQQDEWDAASERLGAFMAER